VADVHGGDAIVAVLREFGVTQFFNVPGESFLPVLDAVGAEPSINLVTNRHESGASFAAEAFAKMTGRPAVCMATRGPGASNLSIGVQTANYDATPMLALVGLIPAALAGSGAFQEFDPLSMFASLSKRSLVVGGREALGPVIAQALTEATTGRPGPVLVGIPTDVLSARAPLDQPAGRPTELSSDPDLGPVLEMVAGAKSPAFLMSTGAVRAAAAETIGELAGRLGWPVFCGWRRYSAFDNGHPSFAGSLGLGSPPAVAAALDRSDLVIALGPLEQISVDLGRLDRPGVTVVNMSTAADPHLVRHLRRPRLVQVVAAPERAARLLAEALAGTPAAAAHGPRRDWPAPVEGELTAAAAVGRLDRWAPADAVIVSDAGNFAHGILSHFRFDRDRVFLGPVNGAMGYGLPGAVGAALADPRRPVVCLAGDGGLLMTVGEMETAVRQNLDLTAVVFNNRSYGTIRSRQLEAFPGREYGTGLGEVRFAELARAMGWRAWPAKSLEELDSALNEIATASGCRLLEVDLPPGA
jgi:acetolactate synthase I/II/III large subunit